MSARPIDPLGDSRKDPAGTLRLVAGVALLLLSVPCLALGLPGIALAVGLLVHATLGRANARVPAMLLGVIAVSTWWSLAWCLVDAHLPAIVASVTTLAIAAAGAVLTPLVLAPLADVASSSGDTDTRALGTRALGTPLDAPLDAPTRDAPAPSTPTPSLLAELLARAASRHITARVAVVLVALAALAPPIWLSPLVGYLLGALGLALGLAIGLPRALRAQRADVGSSPRPPRRSREGLVLASAWTLAALSSLASLQLPAPATPGALGADPRAFDRTRREGPVLVSPHERGFVVSVADGGGVGLVRTPFGRPERVSIDPLVHPGEHDVLRICAARERASVCVVVDHDGVRRDDGPLERARSAYGTRGFAVLALVAGLLLALAIFGARRPRLTRVLAFASAIAFAAFALTPWWP